MREKGGEVDLSFTEAQEELERGVIHPAYLLHGSEAFQGQEFLRALKERVLGGEAALWGLETFEGEEISGPELTESARTLPLLGDKKVLRVKRAERLKEGALKSVEHYLSEPPAGAHLVFEAESLLKEKESPLLRLLRRRGRVVKLEPLKKREAISWLRGKAREKGFSLGGDAAVAIIELSEPSLHRLASELEKLSLFAKKGRPLRPEDVEEVVGVSRRETVFQLAEALGQRNLRASLRSLRRLIYSGERPENIVGMLRRELRLLLRLKARKATRPGAGETFSLKPRELRRLSEEARGWKEEVLEKLLLHLREVDLELKSSSGRGAGRVLEAFCLKASGIL